MAESTQPAAGMDRAGTLQASVFAGVVPDKITILPGHEPDYSACTFCLSHEDHTLGNALRWMIMKDPDVEFCGYSAPHPSEPKIHLRIQMYAVDCLRKALANLRDLLGSVGEKYEASLASRNYKREKDVSVAEIVQGTIEKARLEKAAADAEGDQRME